MAAATIRLGKISSINYSAGKARVVYEDRDDSVTSELPFLAWQYNMPKTGDLVVVACFSNGTVSGVILGPVWNPSNTPHGGAAGVFRQEMSTTKNRAVIEYSEKEKKLTIRAPYIEFEGYEYEDKPQPRSFIHNFAPEKIKRWKPPVRRPRSWQHAALVGWLR